MELEIRKAVEADLDSIMAIFEAAKLFMRKCGNMTQWADGYPQRELMEKEIAAGHCYSCCTRDGQVVATVCLLEGPDPTYAEIYDGNWINDDDYCVIHRLASDGSVKGAGRFCMEWCIGQCGSLRVDTHADNLPMQRLAESCGFVRCGRIRLRDGAWRVAYQRVSDSVKL